MDKSKSGIGFGGVLQIVFIALKLCDVIDWPWWLVLSPSIVAVGMFIVVSALLFLILGIFTYINEKRS